jgi:type VI secretion system secreted protein Hcp
MKHAALAVAVVGAALLASRPAEAQGGAPQGTQRFLQIPGIPGDATEARHKDWIELMSFGQTLTPSRGRRMSCQGEITKVLDRASPALWAAVASGDSFPEMTVEFLKPGRGEGLFLQQKLIDVKVRRVSFQENGASPVEALTLLPESIVLKYFPQLPDGSSGPAIERTISCAHDRDDRFEASDAGRTPSPLAREQP